MNLYFSNRIVKISVVLIVLSLFFGCAETNPKQQKTEFNFDKIIFHCSTCYGTCPAYHLELGADKSIKLFAETVYMNKDSFEKDTLKTGYFKGMANTSTFMRLTNQLKSIGPDSLKFPDVLCCDGVVVTLIVYYNGKRKFLKSMSPPEKAHNLISTLYQICEKSNLTKTTQKFEIESE